MAIVQEEEKAGVAEWVVTFGDMMSLLLTFFIMLVSMSEIKEEDRYQAMVDSLRRTFGHEMSTLSLVPGNARPSNSALDRLASMGRARRASTMKGGDKVRAPVGEHPRVKAIRPAEQATSGGVLVFKAGTSELTEEHKRILQATAQAIGGKPQKIEIRGHTSTRPLPPHGPYNTHWDLAYARCRNVMEYLVKLGIDPRRIRLASAADNEPKYLGLDPILLKENPRVEIFMLNELTDDLKGTAKDKRQEYSNEGAP
jgi:chemotaxis protein MotB